MALKLKNVKYIYIKNKIKIRSYRNCKNEKDLMLYFKKLYELFKNLKKWHYL